MCSRLDTHLFTHLRAPLRQLLGGKDGVQPLPKAFKQLRGLGNDEKCTVSRQEHHPGQSLAALERETAHPIEF